MNGLMDIIGHFRRDMSEGGTFGEVFHRKFANTLYTHKYELRAIRKYYRSGLSLNIGAGRDCGKVGSVSMDIIDGENDYSREYGWEPVKPDVVHDANRFPYPFDTGKFDCVFSTHLLEHLRFPSDALGEMLRITKRHGFVGGILPCAALNPHYNYWRDYTHHTSWSRYDFVLWLERKGFLLNNSLVQYCRMSSRINPWSFDFVLRKDGRWR